ncbi:hypothetical protein J6590_066611 [Homalodisca vitripennis]|nr:hypothetical protein J6590_066611 [Homalodisca vitripennis]
MSVRLVMLTTLLVLTVHIENCRALPMYGCDYQTLVCDFNFSSESSVQNQSQRLPGQGRGGIADHVKHI